MEECIRVEGLTHIYMPDTPFEKVSVENITMSVKKGEFLGIVGHTGSGKSTLIQHFNGLLKPDSGHVFVDGCNIWDEKTGLRDVWFKVGMVFQYAEHQLFEETVYKDIAFGPKNMGIEEKEIDKRIREAAEAVELDEKLLSKSPFELSGGQKRRVAIAGVLAMKPEVLVLDEPAAGLDPKAKERILRMLKKLNTEHGITIVIVSHSMEDIANYADRMVILSHGRVKYEGVPRDIFQNRESLEKIGLSIPQAASVMQRLCDEGFPLDRRACTVSEAVSSISEFLNKNKGNLK